MLEAEGRKEAAFRDAEARERSAQAEAAATQMMSEAMARGDIAALNYLVAEKYMRACRRSPRRPIRRCSSCRWSSLRWPARWAASAQIASGGSARSRAREPRRRAGAPHRRRPTPPPVPPRARRSACSTASVLWLVGGLALCAAETLVPGAFLIWIGAAAVVVGAIEFVYPIALEPALLAFAALVGGVRLRRQARLRLARGRRAAPAPQPRPGADRPGILSRRGDRTRLRPHPGRRQPWRVAGEDLPKGAKVRVVAVEDGARVRVEKA